MFSKLVDKLKRSILHFYYMHIIRNPSKYGRALGARIGKGCNFIEDPEKFLNSEPWLITIGNHVRITYGVRLLMKGHCGPLEEWMKDMRMFPRMSQCILVIIQ